MPEMLASTDTHSHVYVTCSWEMTPAQAQLRAEEEYRAHARCYEDMKRYKPDNSFGKSMTIHIQDGNGIERHFDFPSPAKK